MRTLLITALMTVVLSVTPVSTGTTTKHESPLPVTSTSVVGQLAPAVFTIYAPSAIKAQTAQTPMDPPIAPGVVGISPKPGVTIRSVNPGFELLSNTVETLSYTSYLPLIQTPPPPWAIISTRQESRSYFLTHFVSDTSNISLNWTGNYNTCTPGTTNPVFRDAVLRRVNYYRAVAGVPANVTFSDEYNRITQAAALMMARNNALNHTPPVTWACYSSDGAAGAASSNLSMGNGTYGITNYIQEWGDNNYSVGHRRWILYPQTQEMGTGDVPNILGYFSANALHAWDMHVWDPRPQTRESYVAWPPPGFVPYQIVAARWSFSYPQADFTGAVASMTQGTTTIAVSIAIPVNGYGENTLVWIPNGLLNWDPWPKPQTDTTYHVTVNHVVIDGQDRTFVYDVTVYDPQ
jgi:uncharacterized protein YkwD